MPRKLIYVLLVMLILVACGKEAIESFRGLESPAHFPEPVYRLGDNPISESGFELGRKLFYDPLLSRNNTISCGSCHIQSAAFTHHGHDISHGIDDRLGNRNSPPIMNLAWMPHFFWDGGVFDLDLQPIVPITNHVEMDETMENVLAKLRAHPQYPGLFQRAFGSDEINTVRMMKALSQFMLLCISAESKYDSVKQGLGAQFTPDEQAGYQVFQQHCCSCHKEPLFTDNSFRDNGIGPGPNNDERRYPVTLRPEDRYRFKVPSLRNLVFTAPYMHDGRFYTLEAVLDHYSSGIKPTENLDPSLVTQGQPGLPLSAAEKLQLLAFLRTLSDWNFIHNKKLAE